MKKVQICQAETGGAPVVEVIIEVSRSLLNGDTTLTGQSTLDEHRAVFEKEAALIEDALYNSLPGGTYDQLVGLFLKRKSSHFIVSHSS